MIKPPHTHTLSFSELMYRAVARFKAALAFCHQQCQDQNCADCADCVRAKIREIAQAEAKQAETKREAA